MIPRLSNFHKKATVGRFTMRKISILFFVLLLAIISAGATFAQSTAIVIRNNVRLYETPNVKSRVKQIVKKGVKLNIIADKANVGWYQVSIIPKTEPKDYDELLDQYRTYWIHGNDIKFQSETAEITTAEVKDEWVKYGSSKDSVFYYNPNKTIRRGLLVKVWTEERDGDGELLSKILYEINCLSSKIRSLSGIKYDRYIVLSYTDGKIEKIKREPISSSWDTPNSKFTVIFPDSIGEALYQTVCKK
jgi:hypothetical protein